MKSKKNNWWIVGIGLSAAATILLLFTLHLPTSTKRVNAAGRPHKSTRFNVQGYCFDKENGNKKTGQEGRTEEKRTTTYDCRRSSINYSRPIRIITLHQMNVGDKIENLIGAS